MKNNLWRFLAKSLCVCCVLAAAFALQFTFAEKTDVKPVLFTKADAATYSGECGENVYWSLDTDTGVLNITGSGDMDSYIYLGSVIPWKSYCSYIKTINIENGVTSIGVFAFYNCSSLTSITIPDSITSIGELAFGYCSSLTSINVDENNSNFASVDGVLFNKDKTTLITCPIGNTRTEYNIPSILLCLGSHTMTT